MTDKFKRVFGAKKPVIGMVHLGALPGAPLYDAEGGLNTLVDGARKDLDALQKAGFDAVMFGNENDRPYEFNVDIASPRRWPSSSAVLKHGDKPFVALFRERHDFKPGDTLNLKPRADQVHLIDPESGIRL